MQKWQQGVRAACLVLLVVMYNLFTTSLSFAYTLCTVCTDCATCAELATSCECSIVGVAGGGVPFPDTIIKIPHPFVLFLLFFAHQQLDLIIGVGDWFNNLFWPVEGVVPLRD